MRVICEEIYTYIGDVQGRNYNRAHITDPNNEEKENVISEAYEKRTS